MEINEISQNVLAKSRQMGFTPSNQVYQTDVRRRMYLLEQKMKKRAKLREILKFEQEVVYKNTLFGDDPAEIVIANIPQIEVNVSEDRLRGNIDD